MTAKPNYIEYAFRGINPVPWKAPNVAVIRVKGKAIPKVYKPAEVVAYQEAVKEALVDASLVPFERIDLTFFFYRNAGTKHDHRADATNLQKALEDALQGVLFANDRNVVHVQSWLTQGPDVEPCIVIRVAEADEVPDPKIVNAIRELTAGLEPNFDVEEIF